VLTSRLRARFLSGRTVTYQPYDKISVNGRRSGGLYAKHPIGSALELRTVARACQSAAGALASGGVRFAVPALRACSALSARRGRSPILQIVPIIKQVAITQRHEP
jgi:hypothetical protein